MAPRFKLDDLIGPQKAPAPENDTEGFDPLSDEDYEAIQRGHESPKQTARRNEREQRQVAQGAQRDAARKEAGAQKAAKAQAGQRQSDRQGVIAGAQKAAFSTAPRGLKGLVSGKGGGTLAGTALGFISYAIGINLLRSGPAGIKAWFAAKFLNKTSSPPPSSATTPATKAASPSTSVSVPASSGQPAMVIE
jgi:hypothetical protein